MSVVARRKSTSNVRGCANFACRICAYLVDVLALELLEERAEALLVGVNANRAEDGLDVLSGRRRVAGQAEEEESCEVLHLDGVWRKALAVCSVVAEALVASRSTLTVGLVGLETGESITFKRKRRLNLRVLDGWVVVEILQFSVDRELGRATVG